MNASSARFFFAVAALASFNLVLAVHPQAVNLAQSATATASESQSADLGPGKAIDGKENTRWSGIPGHNSGVWFELRWPRPVQVAEVLVRQYERYSEEWDLQTWDDGAQKWVTRGHFGKKGERLPRMVLARIPLTTTSAVRIANITNGPSFTEVEVYSSEKQYPPTVTVASDLQGSYIGMLTDGLGAQPVAKAHVAFSGSSPGGPWHLDANSDEHGLFTIPMFPNQRGKIAVSTSNGVNTELDAADYQYGLTPLSVGQKRTSLDGNWRFALDPPEGFQSTNFDDSKWSSIAVPGHWEMQGFRSLDGIGGYRRSFELPAGSGRLKLKFDGVYSGSEVWVNGQIVARHEGGFTPFEIDVTDFAHPGANVLAVRVAEHTNVSDNLDKMSQYADFPLAGITRKVYLFRVPDTHISRYSVATQFDSVAGTATLSGMVFGVDEVHPAGQGSRYDVVATLRGPDGFALANPAATGMTIPNNLFFPGDASFQIKIDHPRMWTAETPSLYTLSLELKRNGAVIQRLDQRIGLRQTTVRGSQLLINGQPVKIRGTCHHDADPLMGRAVTVERTREDLRMIKEANLNSLRTSHYPPIPELVEMADEMGLYVEDEADFCWVGVSDDLRNAPRILQLTAELIARDRNHPSVFMWSLCNESEFGYGFERSHEWVRANEPSRPTSAATSAWLEIATLHNPIAIARINENEKLDKPLLFDESLCIYQGIFDDVAEMWIDPGMRDYYAAPLQAVYRVFMDSKSTQGSQIWCWADDIFCVPGRGLEYGRGTTMSHFIDGEYAMPGRGLVGDAPWGVVDGWRRRKPEFWVTKKLHSPVKIAEGELPIPANGKSLQIAVENQYDFTNLSELKTTYTIGSEKGAVQADVAPHAHGVVSVSLRATPHPGDVLDIRFETKAGMLVDEYRLPLGHAPDPIELAPVQATSQILVRDESNLSGSFLEIAGKDFDMMFEKAGGYLHRCVAFGSPVLLELPSLHVLPAEAPTEPIPARTSWSLKEMKWAREGDNVRVTLAGSYPNFEGAYAVTITPAGGMTVKSSFKYTGPERLAREIGLAFSVPRSCDTLHWERNAEWSVYPDDHIGRPIGTTRAFARHAETVPPTWSWSEDNSPMGTHDFRSTKRNIRSAWIAYPSGAAVQIQSNGRQNLRAMVDTDRIMLNVSDWYGGTNVGWGEWITNYGKGKTIHTGEVLESTIKLRLTRRP